MFPEIEGGTQMQPKKFDGTWGKKFENPWSTAVFRTFLKQGLSKMYQDHGRNSILSRNVVER